MGKLSRFSSILSPVGGARIQSLPGQQEFTAKGSYTWVAPPGVTSVSVVCIGGGGGATYGSGGGGGGLGWRNTIRVYPGYSYTVVVGWEGNSGVGGGTSYFINTSTVRGSGGAPGLVPSAGTNLASPGGSFVGQGGGSGGSGGAYTNSSTGGGAGGGGGGAGGYTGNGGNGGDGQASINLLATSGTSGSGGGGGGGGGGGQTVVNTTTVYGRGGNGGGTKLYGLGANGTGGSRGDEFPSTYPGNPGGIGSNVNIGSGYGGGAGAIIFGDANLIPGGGAVRIIWPGNLRFFPNTRTANE